MEVTSMRAGAGALTRALTLGAVCFLATGAPADAASEWDGAYGVSMAPSGSCQRWGGFSAYIEDGRVTVTNSRLSG
ncbi:MAG: hypothetical protein QNJ92_15075, partial [Alphaproteobacteria bacterium]|nr:hypothetical protein [Alphaproteobacteria bacterium]